VLFWICIILTIAFVFITFIGFLEDGITGVICLILLIIFGSISNGLYNYSAKQFNNIDYIVEQESSKGIFALNDNLNISGKMGGGLFYSSGYINEELYYYYVSEREGGKYVDKIPAAPTTIYECDENYRVEHWKKHKEQTGTFIRLEMSESYDSYKLYVPKETLTSDFTVNLK